MNCTVCNKKLSIRNKIGACRKHRYCSLIRKAYESKWRSENKEKYAEAKKQWNRRNAKYFVDYRNSSPSKRIAHALRTRLNRLIRKGRAVKNLGCSISEFLVYLENKFQDGMNWDNYGKWHIDHIKPLSSFDLTDSKSLILACHYSNLQPLWAAENISKYNKLDYIPKSA